MGLNQKFQKASDIIDQLNPDERATLTDICSNIQAAEKDLLQSADELMAQCLSGCEGLCCRNVKIDHIISLWDFIYILIMNPALRGNIVKRLGNEDPIFASDCIFLENRSGPCLFPSSVRPEVCLTTFCGNDNVIKAESLRLKQQFQKLYWFIQGSKLKRRLSPFLRLLGYAKPPHS
ncbi:MAG: hypothetical protein QNI95_20005 [Desulfobacterales bacterium]|nr:hypothetical protein [Desulfobacterales bacterium]